MKYQGLELDLFAQATCWKKYIASLLKPHLGSRVLEVGAGLGGTTQFLALTGNFTEWTCLEPDPSLAGEIRDKIESGKLPRFCRAKQGLLGDIPRSERYDSILYIDVLEHIADDRGELNAAVELLSTGGRLVVFAPAFMCLYSPFDAEVGHYRRYRLQQLTSMRPEKTDVTYSSYVDSVGFMASAANKLMLQQKEITLSQVLLWDRFFVPCSRIIDPLFGRFFGKSALTVYSRTR